MTDVFEGTRSTRDDHATSVMADQDVSTRAPNQRDQLLVQFREAGASGLTDDEAALFAGLLDANYWKRCGELRQRGLISFSGSKRVGLSGILRNVSVLTID